MRLHQFSSLLLSMAAQACFYNPSGSLTGPTDAQSSSSTTDDPTGGEGPQCGDARLEGDEQCDNGADVNGQGGAICKADCSKNVCGDGYLASNEGCDDGNDVDDDACNNECRSPDCGDGVRTPPEECDDGDQPDDDCSPLCKLPACGDGVVGGDEQCDLGVDNGDNLKCTLDCRDAVCGDGKLWTGVETCDDGNAVDGDECPNDCKSSTCGDGELQAAEACDDGNRDDTDACTSLCQEAACGDGFIQPGLLEECDDGPDNGDSKECTGQCREATCGDASVQNGVEECDDGNDLDTDACTNVCKLAACGDGFVQEGEQCDDGNKTSGDGCTHCSTTCGNEVVDDLEECDDGNFDNSDTCNDACERTAYRVFVTSVSYQASFGSTSGADELCKGRALEAQLPGYENYRAWISDPDGSPAVNFTHPVLPFIRVDKVVVASDWGDLIDASLDNPLNVTEFGDTIGAGPKDCSDTGALVWTNTLAAASSAGSAHCAYWSSKLAGNSGRVGHAAAVDSKWTNLCDLTCDKLARLYCIEQP